MTCRQLKLSPLGGGGDEGGDGMVGERIPLRDQWQQAVTLCPGPRWEMGRLVHCRIYRIASQKVTTRL
ncbi:hypothetical protein ElyMa_006478900 [Elysia marginata]|uniref:Uncharacterized protein n=1 Tax=Elysia marginata TaxID=1093978 RepID=A0AAV4I0I0_9GAST|nr:hypothetical protein ElyMa_006478900 [Elysia marginata]